MKENNIFPRRIYFPTQNLLSTWDSLQLNLVMLPVIGIGSLIGIRIVKLLPEKIFRRFIQIVTILSVMHLYMKYIV